MAINGFGVSCAERLHAVQPERDWIGKVYLGTA
jgi:hypothetical protein